MRPATPTVTPMESRPWLSTPRETEGQCPWHLHLSDVRLEGQSRPVSLLAPCCHFLWLGLWSLPVCFVSWAVTVWPLDGSHCTDLDLNVNPVFVLRLRQFDLTPC